MPAWLAAMVQVPIANAVTVLPATLQTVALRLLKATGKPEDALAVMANGAAPTTTSASGLKLMLCVSKAAVMLKLRTTCGAGRKLALPAWSAASVQRPTLIRLTCPAPLTAHTAGVVVANVTTKPELALAVTKKLPALSARSEGAKKLMVCAAGGASRFRPTMTGSWSEER